MHFKAEHRIRGIQLADFEFLYFDEAFNEALCVAVKLKRQCLVRTIAGGRLHREVKVGPDREIPPAAAKILGGSRIEYTEILDYTVGSMRGTWKTVSSLLTDKVDASGTFSFRQDGADVVRVVEGEVKVKIMLVGGVVEGFIAADVEKSYAQAAEFMQGWLRDGKPAGAPLA